MIELFKALYEAIISIFDANVSGSDGEKMGILEAIKEFFENIFASNT